jgi:amino acid adenylation domain-containing protein
MEKKDIQDILSLTPLQEGMLFFYLQAPDSSQYFEQLSLEVTGPLDPALLENAWRLVAMANPALRTVFRWRNVKNPTQVVLKQVKTDIRFHDLSDRQEADARQRVEEIAAEDRGEPLDLEGVPFRVTVCRLTNGLHFMIVSHHHILFDGWSTGVVLKEWLRAYGSLAAGDEQTPVEKPGFKEFVKWLAASSTPEQEIFWRHYLEGFDTKTPLPYATVGDDDGDEVEDFRHPLPPDLCGELRALSRQSHVTVAGRLFCAWGLLLQRYNNNGDVLFGTTVSGRDGRLAGVEDMVGLLINTVPLRLTVVEGETVEDVLDRMQRGLQEREPFETASLADIKQYSLMGGGGELFDSIMVVDNYPLDTLLKQESGGISLTGYSMFEMSNYDLTVGVAISEEEIRVHFNYKIQRFPAQKIAAIASHFEVLLGDMTAHPGKEAAFLEMLTAAEKKMLLEEFAGQKAEYPQLRTVHALVEERTVRAPHRVALVVKDTVWTYGAVNDRADKLAGFLRNQGLGAEDVVALLGDYSAEMAVAMLAVIKAGCAYVPMIPTYPAKRVRYILEDSGAGILLALLDFNEEYPEVETSAKIFRLDDEALYGGDGAGAAVDVPAQSLAFILYTSGSTGKPKGVMVEHRNVNNLLHWMGRFYDFQPGMGVAQLTDYTFDPHVEDIFGTWQHGMVLHTLSREDLLNIDCMRSYIRSRDVAVVNCVPAYLKELLAGKPRLQSLTVVISGGDRLDDPLKDRLLQDGYRLTNHYGLIETTVDVIISTCSLEEHASVGRPMSNNNAYILDRHLNLMPPGAPGEIVIEGDSVVRGYSANPALTDERFVPSPFNPGRRMMRTGDLGRMLDRGKVQILGRMDNQVKIRGYRIELGEIENRMLEHPDVAGAAVTARGGDSADRYLCGYVQWRGQSLELNGNQLRHYTVAQRPGLKEGLEAIHADSWPAFFVGDRVNVEYWSRLYEEFPECQFGIFGQDGTVIAGGNTVPVFWNGDADDLPAGWDEALELGFRQRAEGVKPNTLCVLAGVVHRDCLGIGLSYEVVKVMNMLARLRGFEHVIIPVRPTFKEQFYQMSLEEYSDKKRDDGELYDPWLRVHHRLGGRNIGLCHRSQVIEGSVEDWEIWAGRTFDTSGEYQVKGAMQPVKIDLEANRGLYLDQAVWIRHQPADSANISMSVTDMKTISGFLEEELPDYMVPTRMMCVDAMPLTPIGKIDRKGLPDPKEGTGAQFQIPRTDLESKLRGLWAEILDMPAEEIGVTDNFFDIGGHSLKATRLVYRLQKQMGVKLALRDFIKRPRVADMAQQIKEVQPVQYQTIEPVEERDYYPLSFAQRRLWIICQFEDDSITYNMVGTFSIEGDIKVKVFERALQALVARHHSFRTVFVTIDGEPHQKILKDFVPKVEVIDLRSVMHVARQEAAREIISSTANKAFDLEHGPLIVFKLLRMEDERYVLLVNIHHLVNDGWSLGIIQNEIFTMYNAFAAGKENPLPPLALQYKDYTMWHNAMIRNGGLDRYGDYWLEKLKDKPTGVELPLDFPRPPIQTFKGGRVYFEIDADKTQRLHQMYPQEDATLFMKLMSAAAILLHNYSGQEDILLGAPIAARNRAELFNMIGFLVNSLVYRHRVSPAMTYRQLLKAARKETLDCYENQDFPFDVLVERLGLDRDLSRSPLFNVMLGFDNSQTHERQLEIEGLSFSRNVQMNEFTPSPFDMALVMDEMEDYVTCEIMYNSDLFRRDTAERMAANFLTLIDSILEQKDIPLSRLSYISASEMEQLTGVFNDTETELPRLTVQEMFASAAEAAPDSVAVVDLDRALTYGELKSESHRLAAYLREELGVKPNDIVGISLERSIALIVAILGVIKSGAAYMAVDPHYPMERASYMLENSHAGVLVVDRKDRELAAGFAGTVVCLPEVEVELEPFAGKELPVVNQPGDILYVIYTSGSTGTPNGAMLSHGILANLLQWQAHCTTIDSSLRCLQFTSVSFCVSFQEIMCTLTSGGQVHVIGEVERQDIEYLMDFLAAHRIEILYLPFSYLNFLFNQSGRFEGLFNHRLQHIITAGEQLKISSGLKRFLDRNPHIQLHNHYGSSEMHVVASYTLDAANAGDVPVPPAGRPVANTRIFIMDEQGNPAPIGVWGELCVAGSREVMGYIHNPQLTDRKLFAHPLLSGGGKLYRSGDVGRWTAEGTIELKGRKDFQVKVRGFRVEPDEIESRVLSVPQVEQCVVTVREDRHKEAILVAYVVLGDITVKAVKQALKAYLPQFMIPKFVVLKELPLMSNGKVDRERLPEPGAYDGEVALDVEAVNSYLIGAVELPDTLEGTLARWLKLLPDNGQQSSLAAAVVETADEAEIREPAIEDKTECLTLFAQQVKAAPHRLAVVEDNGTAPLTFERLDIRSDELAALLRRKGLTPGSTVSLLVEEPGHAAAGALGILKAGGEVAAMDADNAQLVVTDLHSEAVKRFSSLQRLRQGSAKLHRTQPRPPIKDFESIPIPDRSMVDYEEYSKYIGISIVKKCISLQATRGCPYKCAYCHKIWPKTHVCRSAEHIFDEVKLYYDMGVRRFVIIDDVFNLNIKNSSRFYKMLLDHKMKVELYFASGLRGDILTRDYMDLMIEAGTVDIGLSLETASPRLQKMMGKNLQLDRFRENIEYLAANYPQVILDLNTMHGFPTETEEEAMMTMEFIKSVKWIHFPYVHILKILPNTDMERLALENGVTREQIEESANLGFHELPTTLPFDKSFSRGYQADFFNNYFMSKERLKHVLPYQMELLTEDDIVQKYNSYVPEDIRALDDLLRFVGIEREELRVRECVSEESTLIPDLNQKLRAHFPRRQSEPSAARVLMLDLSQFFTHESDQIYDVIEPPLGPMYLLTYLYEQLGGRVNGKIAKSRFDFDNYEELRQLILDFDPHVIGIRTLSYYKEFYHKTIAMIRQWGIDTMIVTGGPYATSDYKTVLQDRHIDVVVMGEGEITFCRFIEAVLEHGNQMPPDQVLEQIQGLVFVPRKEEAEGFGREVILLEALDKTEGAAAKQPLSHWNHITSPAPEQRGASVLVPLLKGQTLLSAPESLRSHGIRGVQFRREQGISARILLDGGVDGAAASDGKQELNPMERRVADLWADILDTDGSTIGPDDNFFDIGGHSLKATTMMTQIHKEFSVRMKLIEIFKTPTVREIARFIEKAGGQAFSGIPPAAAKEFYRCSPAQRRLFVAHELDPQSTGYNMPAAMEVVGDLDVDKLQTTFKQLVRRHESFRTSFRLEEGEPVQTVANDVDFQVDVTPPNEGPRKEIIEAFIRPFDLSSPPLLRVRVVPEAKARYLLLVDMHHIVSDGASVGIVIQEFFSLYSGGELPPPTVQYKDFAEWSAGPERRQALAEQEKYWLQQLAGPLEPLDLPTDFPRPELWDFAGADLQFTLDVDVTAKLNTLARKHDATLYMTLLAALNVVLSKYSGKWDIIVGASVAGRRHADLAGVVGMFINMLPLRNCLSPDTPFQEFLGNVGAGAMEAFENQDLPFDHMVKQLGVERESSRNPLFDVEFTLQNLEIHQARIPGLELNDLPIDTGRTKFDLTIHGLEQDGGIQFVVEYSTALFKEETAREFARHFSDVLAQVAENPSITIGDINVSGGLAKALSTVKKEEISFGF